MIRDEKYFLHPAHSWQRRYEALRASFVDRLPAKTVADKFGFTPEYVNLLRHQFRHGKIDFSEPVPEGKTNRYRVDADGRRKICELRENRCSAGDIAEILFSKGYELSVRTVERVLSEEGYPKLPRRFFTKTGITVQGSEVPEKSHIIKLAEYEGKDFNTDHAGLFLFAPFIEQLGLPNVIAQAKLPGSKVIPSLNNVMSFLALKLMGNERYAHVGKFSFDPGPGLFVNMNNLPKCTHMSTYAYSLSSKQTTRLQGEFVSVLDRKRLISGKFVNLDFHTSPHNGDDAVLDDHWAGARNKTLKGVLSLFAQDSDTKMLLYTESDIVRGEEDDQILRFMEYWKKVHRGVKPTLVFDSKFTTYKHLSQLNEDGIKFITLRRRGKKMIDDLKKLGRSDWQRITIPHEKRKYKHPHIHETYVTLKDYDGEVRQIIMKGNGREEPAFIVTNDENLELELVVGTYARRWRVENGIAEAVKFFNLNSLSSPILVKVSFDNAMTMIADTLYSLLAQKLRGFEHCHADKIYRHFIRGRGKVCIGRDNIHVVIPKRSHNPILRDVGWHRLPTRLSWLGNARLTFDFK
jgi:hypothetical protein